MTMGMTTATATATTIHTITNALRWLLLAALLGAPAACSEPVDTGSPEAPRDGFFYGRVTRVADGDTLTMKTADGRALRIRLAEIDTPEKGEPFANRARTELNRMVRDRDIAVRLFDVDSYGRIVGRVYVDDLDVVIIRGPKESVDKVRALIEAARDEKEKEYAVRERLPARAEE